MENSSQDAYSHSQPHSHSNDNFIDSIKAGLNDAEKLLREAATSTGDKAIELRDKAIASIKSTQDALCHMQEVVVERTRRAARLTDEYVHDKPWQAIGIAGITGLLLGVLIGRR